MVLLVEQDEATRKQMTGWLYEAGFNVLTCLGPLPPTYTCHGVDGGACRLAELADVVVLDLLLDSDVMMEGTPGWQILSFYQALAKPVVALVGPGDCVRPIPDDALLTIRRPPIREQLLSAVGSLIPGVRSISLAGDARVIALPERDGGSQEAGRSCAQPLK